MMTANEFFDCGQEPLWLVDACGGEVVSPNSESEFSYRASSSSAPYLELNYGTEAGPSNITHMDVEEENRPNGASFAYNHLREFERLQQQLSSGIQSLRPAVPLAFEQQRSWSSVGTPSVVNRVPTRKLATPPAADLFFRACKKRKRSYA